MDKSRSLRNDDPALRKKAREAIDSGRLPQGKPDRTYGGAGGGMACAVCGVVVPRSDIELEIEFTRQDATSSESYHLHPRCFAAWDAVARSIGAGDPAASVSSTS